MMRQIHEKLGVSEELAADLKQALMQADWMPLCDKIRDPYLDAAKQLDQMESKIRQCNAWDALDAQKREEVITSIAKEIEQTGFQAPGKEMCQIYESRMEEYQILKKSDPDLANIAFGMQEIANYFHEELDLQSHDQEQDMERE